MSNGRKIFSALLIGATAGAVLGLLFAPEKGSRLRRRISDKSQDIIEDINDKIDEGMDVLKNLKKKASDFNVKSIFSN